MRATTFSGIESLPFSFLSREMNFLGGITPTFFFCVAMLLNRSDRQVRRDSLRRGCTWRGGNGSLPHSIHTSTTYKAVFSHMLRVPEKGCTPHPEKAACEKVHGEFTGRVFHSLIDTEDTWKQTKP